MKADILPDGGRINRSSIEAMRAWSAIFGVHQVEILVAVAAVGSWHGDVRTYLEERFCFSSRESIADHDLPVPETGKLAA